VRNAGGKRKALVFLIELLMSLKIHLVSALIVLNAGGQLLERLWLLFFCV
jgi:hypothetical protein